MIAKKVLITSVAVLNLMVPSASVMANTGTFYSTDISVYATTSSIVLSSKNTTICFLRGRTYTYTGEQICPILIIKCNGKTLEKNEDYKLDYENNIQVSGNNKAKIIITGQGEYSGTVSSSFTITADDDTSSGKTTLSSKNTTVTLAQKDYSYTGSAIKPSITVKCNNKVLTEKTDYKIRYVNNVKPGVGLIYIMGTNNYSGRVYVKFNISEDAKSISGATISGINSSYTYKGTGIRPTPIVTIGSKTLRKGTDYTVSYSNYSRPGTATVTITGIGKYTGTVSKTYQIVANTSQTSISSATVTNVNSSYSYTGGYITPEPVVKVGSTTLKKNTDYYVSYSSNKAVGAATITIRGINNYKDTKTVTFKITETDASKKSISGATVTGINQIYYYTGSAITPSFTVKLGSTTLIKLTDYTVEYSNNTNVGTATITISGAGKYKGTVTKTFRIVNNTSNTKTSISNEAVTNINSSYTYTGLEIKPIPVVKVNGVALTNGADYTITYSNNKNIGTATVTITGKGKYNGTIKKTFTIKAAKTKISSATISGIKDEYEYTGSAIKPNPTVKIGSKTLTKNTDYTVSYSASTNIGTVKITITGKGDYTGSVTKKFNIIAKVVSINSPKATKGTMKDKIKISWGSSKNSQVKGYKIQVQEIGSNDWIDVKTVSNTTNSYTYDFAKEFVDNQRCFNFRVLCKGSDGKYRETNNTGVCKGYGKTVICLDPGHYGTEGKYQYSEAKYMLELGNALQGKLEGYGIDVVMTRTEENNFTNGTKITDNGAQLLWRGKKAENCDFFISLHTNAAGNTWNESYNDVEAYINWSACSNNKLKFIRDIATAAAKEIPGCKTFPSGYDYDKNVKKTTGTASNQIILRKSNNGTAYYAVLRGADSVKVPGVLLEHSFHTNSKVRKFYVEDNGAKKIANAEAKAIAQYYGFI